MDLSETEWHHRNLNLGRDWKVDDVRCQLTPLKVKVLVSFIGEHRCPMCGRGCICTDTHTREWRDLDHGRAGCHIVAEVPMMRCTTCGTHEIDVPWAGRSCNLTRRLEDSSCNQNVYSR